MSAESAALLAPRLHVARGRTARRGRGCPPNIRARQPERAAGRACPSSLRSRSSAIKATTAARAAGKSSEYFDHVTKYKRWWRNVGMCAEVSVRSGPRTARASSGLPTPIWNSTVARSMRVSAMSNASATFRARSSAVWKWLRARASSPCCVCTIPRSRSISAASPLSPPASTRARCSSSPASSHPSLYASARARWRRTRARVGSGGSPRASPCSSSRARSVSPTVKWWSAAASVRLTTVSVSSGAVSLSASS